MIHDIKPLKKAKMAVTTRHDPPVVFTLRRYAIKTKQDQYQVIETGLKLIPGFRHMLEQEQEAYDANFNNNQRQQDGFIKEVREHTSRI